MQCPQYPTSPHPAPDAPAPLAVAPTASGAAPGNPAVAAAGSLRLFLGLWPDEAQRQQARAHQQLWRWPPCARPTPASKLHLTVHFLGQVPRERLDALVAALPTSFMASELVLAQPSVWRGGIAVLEPQTVPPALLTLQGRLGMSLRQLGLTPDERPWRPHLTLARQAQGALPPERAPALRWRVTQLALVQSEGGLYTVLKSVHAGG